VGIILIIVTTTVIINKKSFITFAISMYICYSTVENAAVMVREWG